MATFETPQHEEDDQLIAQRLQAQHLAAALASGNDDNGQNARAQNQADSAGVNRASQDISASGLGGAIGFKQPGSIYTAGTVDDTTTGDNKNALGSRISAIGARPAPTVTAAQANAAQSQAAFANGVNINAAPQDQVRQQQMGLASNLARAAAGQGPSVAQTQLQEATDKNIASNFALANSEQGGNPATALRTALMANAGANQQAALQSAQVKAQEQQAAQQQLAGVLDSTRGTDVGLATNQAGLTQQTNLTNAGNQQQTNLANATNTQQTNLANAENKQAASSANANLSAQTSQEQDAAVAQLMQMGMSLDQAKMQMQLQQQQFNADLLARQEAARQGVAMQAGAQGTQLAGAAIGAIGTGLAMASDRKLKKNVKKGDKDVEALMSALKPSKYQYKDGDKHGHGERLGIMAQDAEKSGLGRALVMNHKDGKHIDVTKALGAALAAVANLHGRVRKLEA